MRRIVAVAAVALLGLTACGGDGGNQGDATTGGPVTITDPWVKATEDGMHMTGAFGTLANTTGEDIHVVGVTSPVTDRAELHEMVDQGGGTPVMKEMDDGFVIPANSEFVLEPGGNHLMLMQLMDPIEPGEVVEFTLEFEGGETFTFESEARTYAGANESYEGDDGMGGHGEMGGNGGGMETATP